MPGDRATIKESDMMTSGEQMRWVLELSHLHDMTLEQVVGYIDSSAIPRFLGTVRGRVG